MAQKKLSEAQVLLDGKQSELDEVQKVFNIAYGKQQIVYKNAMALKGKTDMASSLINGLTGEHARWSGMLAHFNVEKERLVGDAMLLTGKKYFEIIEKTVGKVLKKSTYLLFECLLECWSVAN